MRLMDWGWALLVVLVWGVNFVVIHVGLVGVPPLLLGALRFLLVALPAVFFVPRPRIPLRWLLAYGLTISFGSDAHNTQDTGSHFSELAAYAAAYGFSRSRICVGRERLELDF